MDRTQRKVLYVLNKMRTDEDFNATKFYNQTKIFDIDKMYQLCKDLEDDHWIDFLATDLTKRITMIELSYKGITYRYHLWCSFLKKVWDWFTANLVGLAAFVISLIALLRGL